MHSKRGALMIQASVGGVDRVEIKKGGGTWNRGEGKKKDWLKKERSDVRGYTTSTGGGRPRVGYAVNICVGVNNKDQTFHRKKKGRRVKGETASEGAVRSSKRKGKTLLSISRKNHHLYQKKKQRRRRRDG